MEPLAGKPVLDAINYIPQRDGRIPGLYGVRSLTTRPIVPSSQRAQRRPASLGRIRDLSSVPARVPLPPIDRSERRAAPTQGLELSQAESAQTVGVLGRGSQAWPPSS